MSNSVTIRVTLDKIRLDRMRDGVMQAAADVLTAAAINAQEHAIARTQRVETGAMKNGWRVSPPTPPPAGLTVDPQRERIIYNTQEYAIYHELGTSRMSAMPMLVPAIEAIKPALEQGWRKMLLEFTR